MDLNFNTWGTGFVQERFRDIFPPPHFLEHGVPTLDQGDQPPLMSLAGLDGSQNLASSDLLFRMKFLWFVT